MYAERYAGPGRFNPGGLAAAVGINAAVVAALMFAAPTLVPRLPDKPIVGTLIDLDPPPPPDPVVPPQPKVRIAPRPRAVDAPKPLVPTTAATDGIVAPADPGPIPIGDTFGTGTGTEAGVIVDPPKPALPLIVGPAPDPRYAGAFQPPYPPSEQRLGNVGRVTVRVLVGADGKVREVERVSATSDAFFQATERQALGRWRFRPGTRDGVAQAAWRVMTVTFVLED